MAFLPEHAYEHIARAYEHGRLAHALLISGPRDCGKSALAAKISWLLQGKNAQGTDLFGDPIISDPLPLEEQECDAVARGEKPAVTGQQGLAALELALKVTELARLGM